MRITILRNGAERRLNAAAKSRERWTLLSPSLRCGWYVVKSSWLVFPKDGARAGGLAFEIVRNASDPYEMAENRIIGPPFAVWLKTLRCLVSWWLSSTLSLVTFTEHLPLPGTVPNPSCELSYLTSHQPQKPENPSLATYWWGNWGSEWLSHALGTTRFQAAKLGFKCMWSLINHWVLCSSNSSAPRPANIQRSSAHSPRPYVLSPKHIYSPALSNYRADSPLLLFSFLL